DFNDARTTAERADEVAKQAAAHLEAIAREIELTNKAVGERAAAIEQAKGETNSGELHSPADGIVMTRTGQAEEQVDRSMRLMAMAKELTKLQAIVTPDGAALGRIRPGQAAVVRLGDADAAGVVAEVRAGDVSVNFEVGSPVTRLDSGVQVRIRF